MADTNNDGKPDVDANKDGWIDGTKDPYIVTEGGGGSEGGTGGTPQQPWRAPAPEGAWVPKGASEVFVDTSSLAGVSGASNYNSPTWNLEMGKGDLAGALSRPEMNSPLFALVAQGRGHNSTANGVFQQYVAESSARLKRGERITPQQLAYQEALDNGWITDGAATLPTSGGGRTSGGGGGAAAPVAADPSSIRRAMDQVTMGLLGRSLSEKEFNKYYKSYVAEFNANPNMDPQQDMIERSRMDENYQEYQVATKFAGALDSVLKGAA